MVPDPRDLARAPSPTGDVTVAVQQRLDTLADLPVHEHPAVYGEVHELLQEVLARLDEG